MNKAIRIIINIVYGCGAVLVIGLGCVALFGSNKPVNPSAMIPFTWREQAFLCLAFGSVPMLLASMAVYRFHRIKNSLHKIRNLLLLFLPAFICSACALFVIGALIVGMVNSFLQH